MAMKFTKSPSDNPPPMPSKVTSLIATTLSPFKSAFTIVNGAPTLAKPPVAFTLACNCMLPSSIVISFGIGIVTFSPVLVPLK